LANVEFLVALTAPRRSSLYSRFWLWLFRGIVAVFPVAVLLLVQVNALRYQSELVMWVQRGTLALDLAALMWFFRRNLLDGSEWPVWPAVVLALNLFLLNNVPPDADVNLVRYSSDFKHFPILSNPLDTLLCPRLNWGCRYLRVDRRTLVDHVWDSKAMADLHALRDDRTMQLAKALAGIDGLVLRDRSFRFAVLDRSRLYAGALDGVDLRGASLLSADLSGADLHSAKLQGAVLNYAELEGAHLDFAELQDANLNHADFQDATLFDAHLQGAHLNNAELQGADLSAADLQSADLIDAHLQGADLTYAHLEGADLTGAILQGAGLTHARLQGADLTNANLEGADLTEADLRGANLTIADLRGANLRSARLWHMHTTKPADFHLADVREVDFHTALTSKGLRQILEEIPNGNAKQGAEKRLEHALLLADQPSGKFDFEADRTWPVLVSAPPELAFAMHPEWLITEPRASYTEALAGYLASMASNPFVAARVARIISRELLKPR